MINTIPVIDISLMDGSETEYRDFLSQLRIAAHEVGFFYLSGHGVDPALLTRVQQLARQLFSLTESEKSAISMINSPHFRGYSHAAAEFTRGRQDWREQFDMGAERAAVTMLPDMPPWLGMHGPNQWPVSIPELKNTLLKFQQIMTVVALKLLRAFALALELPETSFDGIYGAMPNEHMKLIRYPGRDVTSSDQGVGAHKDSGLLTFVLQDKQRGLQVEVAENQWIDVAPRDNLLVVNIGELLELATNGYLRATMHRVITPPEGRERLSVAYFLGATLDCVVPLYALPAHLAVEATGVAVDPDNPLLREVGMNYLKGRFRSHPDVAEKFYRHLWRL